MLTGPKRHVRVQFIHLSFYNSAHEIIVFVTSEGSESLVRLSSPYSGINPVMGCCTKTKGRSSTKSMHIRGWILVQKAVKAMGRSGSRQSS